VEFKCLLAVVICGFEFEQDGKRDVAVKVGFREEPQGGYPLRLGRWLVSEIFANFVNVVCSQGVKEGRIKP